MCQAMFVCSSKDLRALRRWPNACRVCYDSTLERSILKFADIVNIFTS